ncbi:hypothetical protein CURTO8I2_60103 [Curtobacterium sp. 8I-2]|nr:hypothetical protein CURTO8I2_60103 [Curtobacterium sp. 8I-2]
MNSLANWGANWPAPTIPTEIISDLSRGVGCVAERVAPMRSSAILTHAVYT